MGVADDQGSNIDSASLGRLVSCLIACDTRWRELICVTDRDMLQLDTSSVSFS